MFALGQLANEFPEIEGTLKQSLSANNLKIPSKLGLNEPNMADNKRNVTGSKFSSSLRAKANGSKTLNSSQLTSRSVTSSRDGSIILKSKTFVPEFN